MVRDVNENGLFEAIEVFYYTKDHLGSIRELLDANGNVYQKYSYTAYGETRIEKQQALAGNGFIENRYAFTSRELDEHT